MEIADVNLKGECWGQLLNAFSEFFSAQSQQPNYSVYSISVSIGIMYDKQSETAGEETEESKDNPKSVPRTVLYQHNTDLDFLFQAAILTSNLVNYNEKERMDLAFNTKCPIKLNKLDFLTKFANFGAQKLLEQVADESVETMQKLKSFVAATVEGYNHEIDSISLDDIDIDDIEN